MSWWAQQRRRAVRTQGGPRPPTALFRAPSLSLGRVVLQVGRGEVNCEIDLQAPREQGTHDDVPCTKRGVWLDGVAEGRQILVFGGDGGLERAAGGG